jgi:mannose-1-phosphate guanylyltransferase
MKKSNNYIVIMAGGKGTRLWPMSRNSKPKQLQNLIGKNTMIQDTFNRVKKIVPIENIYISTNKRYEKIIKKQLSKIKKQNFIIEPAAKNTAPAIGLVASIIGKRNKDSVVTTVASDHVVTKEKNFIDSIKACQNHVRKYPSMIGTVGIMPTVPHICYGYIQKEKQIGKLKNVYLFKVKKFVEKPDKKTAEKYLKSGDFFWNASYFTFSALEILDYFKKYETKIYKNLKLIFGAVDTKQQDNVINNSFKNMPELAFDYLVEKLNNVFVVPTDLGWDDIGSWEAIKNIISSGEIGVVVERGNHLGIDNHDSLIYAQDKLVCTIGLNNLVVVDTDDVLFVCNKSRSQDVKKMIEKLQNNKKYHKYL